ncbi:hypothetical protein SDC9_129572 [bioreactor metagenome]|uniref:Uncharacterized protein n=1 Tax=bioreactor metagenome TaxID=1076179 RepID=A0A645D062_9ZZZZ
MDIAIHSFTSKATKVSIDVEPNNVLQTSPDTLADLEKTFKIKYPKANAPTESIAIAASPLIFAFWLDFNSITAAMVVTGKIISMLSVRFKTVPNAIAPNATCDNPSPIKDILFNTNVTPKREEQSATNIPTTIAYLTKGYSM